MMRILELPIGWFEVRNAVTGHHFVDPDGDHVTFDPDDRGGAEAYAKRMNEIGLEAEIVAVLSS